MKRRRIIVVGAILGFVLLALILWVTRKTWTEEVMLSSGSVMVIERTVYYKNYSPDNLGFGWSPRSHAVRFLIEPSGLRIPAWEGEWHPMILDYDVRTQTPFIVALRMNCFGQSPYVLFRIHNGVWEESAWEDSLVGRKANLLMDDASAGKYVTLADKEISAQSPTRAKELKEVLGKGFRCP